MNRNTNMHFAETPQINIKRSSFDESHSIKTTFNVGDIVPIMVDEILPGDTVEMDVASLVRMATPIYPIMDNLYMDQYWFFVPNRLLWAKHAEFWGENDDPWTQQTEYEIPQISAPTGGWTEGTIADYMGIPTKKSGFTVNALPMRAYAKIYNDWFRNQNTNSVLHMYDDETTRTGSNGTNPITDCELGGKPAKAAKFHDYFTAALPSPQKGEAVTIPLGTLAEATFPLNTKVDVTTGTGRSTNLGTQGLELRNLDGTYLNPSGTGDLWNIQYNSQNRQGYLATSGAIANGQNQGPIAPSNLYTDLSGKSLTIDMSNATGATINALRMAFACQKYFENAALHGTRYIEYLKGVFGVTSSDARFQRAEYLGGKRIPINIDQIIQTSSTNDTSPMGNTAGFSCTIDRNSAFTKSFEEHGVLMCLAVVRVDHSYQQGLDRMWTRKKWLDFYNPFFAHIGEQAILNKEIYLQGTNVDDEAFGYQEAWAEYRYKQNKVTGYMRSNAQGSLDVWHFADNYNALPTLSPGWMEEPKANVDRTIAVTSQLMHQFIGDFYFRCKYTRPMPVYSVPGLIDHV